jgi:alpha-D-ribose 1-methylphosphonate 5-triphosphate synthase subunit PhnL
MMSEVLRIRGLTKRFRLHLQGHAEISVFSGFDLTLAKGEVLAVTGPSGMGKSSLLKLIYGTYRADAGEIAVRQDNDWTNVVGAEPRIVLDMRRCTVGYVTQFLRVIPRVPAIDIVAEPLLERGIDAKLAKERAAELLARLMIPERLWQLSPVTFSGGEQQRVNIARGFAAPFPIMLLDEPTASLDEESRRRVLSLIADARDDGSAIIAIFHNAGERREVATRIHDLGDRR